MKKKLAVGIAAAAVVAAGVGVNRCFEPGELIHDVDGPAAEYTLRAAPSGGDVFAEYAETERMSRADRVRARFLRLPAAVKSAALLPLWAVGALPAALAPVLGPVWGALAALTAQAGVLAGLFCLVYKLLFPRQKIRQLFRRKNIKWLLLGAFTVTAANALLCRLWPDWPALRALLLTAAGFGVLWLLWKRLCGHLRGPAPRTVRTKLSMEY